MNDALAAFHLSWRVATCEALSMWTVRFAHVRKNCDARRRSDLPKGRRAHKDSTTLDYVKKKVVDKLSVQGNVSTREVKSSFTHESRTYPPDTTEIASTNDKQRVEDDQAKQRWMERKTVGKLQF